jgi:hypothetical protein
MRRHAWIAVILAAAAALAFLGVRGRQRQADQDYLALGLQVSQAEAVAKTRSLGTRIWPDLQNLGLSPELMVTRGVHSPVTWRDAAPNAWQVLCEDSRGYCLGTITWDAATGELISVVAGRPVSHQRDASYPDMSRAEMRGLERQWIRDLSTALREGSWRQTRETAESHSVNSDWASTGRTAHLSVNMQTGELVLFHVSEAGERVPSLQTRAQ